MERIANQQSQSENEQIQQEEAEATMDSSDNGGLSGSSESSTEKQ